MGRRREEVNFGGGGVELQVQDLSLACRLGVLGDKPPADSARRLAEKAGERQKVRSLGLRLRRRRRWKSHYFVARCCNGEVIDATFFAGPFQVLSALCASRPLQAASSEPQPQGPQYTQTLFLVRCGGLGSYCGAGGVFVEPSIHRNRQARAYILFSACASPGISPFPKVELPAVPM